MRIIRHTAIIHRLAVPAAIAAALSVGTVQADVSKSTRGLPSNIVEYDAGLRDMQLDIDRRQAELDREQARLDRRKYRFRESLDGYISKAEAQAVPTVASVFGSLDDDGDGQLSVSEYQDITPFMTGAPMTSR